MLLKPLFPTLTSSIRWSMKLLPRFTCIWKVNDLKCNKTAVSWLNCNAQLANVINTNKSRIITTPIVTTDKYNVIDEIIISLDDKVTMQKRTWRTRTQLINKTAVFTLLLGFFPFLSQCHNVTLARLRV